MPPQRQKVLILCKTNPTPSDKYIETVCMAGMRPDGSLIRLYPIPFRLLQAKDKFQKWQYIDILVEKNPNDHRPESYKVYVEGLEVGNIIDTKQDWKIRRQLLETIHCYTSMQIIKQRSDNKEISLALLKPAKLLRFEIKPATEREWTSAQKDYLRRASQGDLFEEVPANIQQLQKTPYDFYLHFEDETGASLRHKILDWEIGALYWNVCKQSDWQEKMKEKMDFIFQRDVYFLMGNEHRFQHNWHIISLIYPPKQPNENLSLF